MKLSLKTRANLAELKAKVKENLPAISLFAMGVAGGVGYVLAAYYKARLDILDNEFNAVQFDYDSMLVVPNPELLRRAREEGATLSYWVENDGDHDVHHFRSSKIANSPVPPASEDEEDKQS